MSIELSVALGVDAFIGLIFYALKKNEEAKLADISQAVEISDGVSVNEFLSSNKPVIFSGSLQLANPNSQNKYNAVTYKSSVTEIGEKLNERSQKWESTSRPIKTNEIVCDAIIKRDISRKLLNPFSNPSESIVLPKLKDIPGSDALFTTVLDDFIPVNSIEANGYRLKGMRLKETAIFNGTVVSVVGRLTSMGGILTLKAPIDCSSAFMISTGTKEDLLSEIKSRLNIFTFLLGLSFVVGGAIAVPLILKRFNKRNHTDRGDDNQCIQ